MSEKLVINRVLNATMLKIKLKVKINKKINEYLGNLICHSLEIKNNIRKNLVTIEYLKNTSGAMKNI